MNQKRTYKHMGKVNEISGAHLSDTDVAHKVRMLLRSDLGHEHVVCMARDRILCLVQEKEEMLNALENLTIAVGMGWDLEGVTDIAREVIDKANGTEETKGRMVQKLAKELGIKLRDIPMPEIPDGVFIKVPEDIHYSNSEQAYTSPGISAEAYKLIRERNLKGEKEDLLSWMVVGMDNLGRESVADIFVQNRLTQATAEALAREYNAESDIGDGPGTFYQAVEDTYRLSRGMEDL